MKTADTIVLIWFATLGLVTFLAFGFDKWRAGRSGRRVSEFALVMLAALIPFAAEIWAWLRWR